MNALPAEIRAASKTAHAAILPNRVVSQSKASASLSSADTKGGFLKNGVSEQAPLAGFRGGAMLPGLPVILYKQFP